MTAKGGHAVASPDTYLPKPTNPNPEPRTPNPEPRTPNSELRTPNSELRTPNSELRTNENRLPSIAGEAVVFLSCSVRQFFGGTMFPPEALDPEAVAAGGNDDPSVSFGFMTSKNA